ncbi:MAG: hypothetical protein KBT34_09820 [Prevotella sp.]|nr:hypothetical protein [Candidatus Prevotella equi]
MATKNTGSKSKGGYVEPTSYFSKDQRKKYGLGEYAKKTTTKKSGKK